MIPRRWRFAALFLAFSFGCTGSEADLGDLAAVDWGFGGEPVRLPGDPPAERAAIAARATALWGITCAGVQPDNAMIQYWLDYAGAWAEQQGTQAELVFPAHHYCLDGPLRVPSSVTFGGSGPSATILEQTQPGAATLILDQVEDAVVRDLGILMKTGDKRDAIIRGQPVANPNDLAQSPPPRCFPNSAVPCRWRAMRGVALYGTTDARLENLRIVGGYDGVHFADNDNFFDPGAGATGGLLPNGQIRSDLCWPDGFPANVGAEVTDLEIVDSVWSGILVDNLVGGTVRRNIVRGVGRYTYDPGSGPLEPSGMEQGFGLKFRCGPVAFNEFSENMITDVVGDGVDIAWAWPKGTPADAVLDEIWEGHFYANAFVRNVIYDCEGAVEIKSRGPGRVPNEQRVEVEPLSSAPGVPLDGCAYHCGSEPADAPSLACHWNQPFTPPAMLTPIETPDRLLRIGSHLQVSQNLILDRRNLLGGSGGMISLRDISTLAHGCFPESPGQPSEATKVHQNVLMTTGTRSRVIPERSRLGASVWLARTANVSVFGNWIGDNSDGGEVSAVSWQNRTEVFASMFEETDPADWWDLSNGSASWPIETGFEAAGTPTNRDALIRQTFTATDGTHFFCEDIDGDGCVNGCEALHGGDPTNAAVPAGANLRSCRSCAIRTGCVSRGTLLQRP
ncbi:MAG: hypothetical protein JJ863_11040 [Deltaproteobacteria bacterium]|nr:hypothetical protein [Deltaproteobacteria bacterium]